MMLPWWWDVLSLSLSELFLEDHTSAVLHIKAQQAVCGYIYSINHMSKSRETE